MPAARLRRVVLFSDRLRGDLPSERSLPGQETNRRGLKDVEWHGCRLHAPGWLDPTSRVLAFTIGDIPGDGSDIHAMLNMDDIEIWAIKRALRQTGGNVSHAAKLLNISRDTLHTKIKKNKDKIDREAIVNTPAPADPGETVSVE